MNLKSFLIDNIKKIKITLIAVIAVVAVYSFVNIIASAQDNNLGFEYLGMDSIETGTAPFINDGLDYNTNGNKQIDGYTAGNDTNASNRIIRSFDKITYHFSFKLDQNYPISDAKVNVLVSLPDAIKDYVTCSESAKPGNNTCNFTFDNVSSFEDSFAKEITLYVLGAPNGTLVDPKFTFNVNDSSKTYELGNVSTDASSYKNQYEYDIENGYSLVSPFTNYLPSVVSSKTAVMGLDMIGFPNKDQEGQKAVYEDKVGRYLTYVFGLRMIGNDQTGLKGYTMPQGDISLDATFSQNGSSNVIVKDSWARLYELGTKENIDPVTVGLPFSDKVDDRKKVRFPGTIASSSGTDTANNINKKLVISNYTVTYDSVKENADNTQISPNSKYIGTYAYTVFSPRESADLKNEIIALMQLNNGVAQDTKGENITINNNFAKTYNDYYEVKDYSLKGEFYNESNVKISQHKDSEGKLENGYGSTSKGSNIKFKTTFKYNKTLSNQGLKEVIKVDTNAYRVMPINDKNDVKITVNTSSDKKITNDDFEVKFVTGDWNNSNYSIDNNQASSANERLAVEDKDKIVNACQSISSNLGNYSISQIMNLYGGPCLKANENVEQEFDKISSAKEKVEGEKDKELPITKVIIQTKKGVVLPDDAVVVVDVGLRVRNVKSLTQTYSVVAIATSSDYDTTLNYYSPIIPSVGNDYSKTPMDPDNYKKTDYVGSNVTFADTASVWGDSLRIVNFTSRQTVTVTNKNEDGTTKTKYYSSDNDIINYNIKTSIVDDNIEVGADDVWYINHLIITVEIPNELTYVPNEDLGTPEVSENQGKTYLTYTLPYTKANRTIPEINFNATVKPNVSGQGKEVTVTSHVDCVNINNEIDNSYFGDLYGSFSIFVSGVDNVIIKQAPGVEGTVVDRNQPFSYVLSGYNNTSKDVTDYQILDILPQNGDSRESVVTGKYNVKIDIPSDLSSAKVLCSKQSIKTLKNNVENVNNQFEECNITEDYVSGITAFKITNIKVNTNSSFDNIVVHITPVGNKYSDTYNNNISGATGTYKELTSNTVKVRVISRNITGVTFIDSDMDGIRDKEDALVPNQHFYLYKIDNSGNFEQVQETFSDKNGRYKFKDLDSGLYRVRSSYDNSKYDLTVRYGTDDTSIDSDAYKVEEGDNNTIIEISNKTNPKDGQVGILVNNNIESVKYMDVGLISKQSFALSMNKYITKIDLTASNVLTTYNYNNESTVNLSVKNSMKASAKVYYGMTVTNNSTKPGYAKLINEDIPAGLIFDPSDPYNEGWISVNGSVQSAALANEVIEPGESKYLKIALFMPPQAEAHTFINTVSIIDYEIYDPEALADDLTPDNGKFEIGDSVTMGKVNFHVIGAKDGEENDQILTLLADSGTISNKMGHTSSSNSIYKWSDSLINKYINAYDGGWLSTNMLNPSIYYDAIVCDDASGLQVNSYGGNLYDENNREMQCQSNIYNTSKVRLLTDQEFASLLSQLTDTTWLRGSSDFWLMNSVYITQEHDAYGRLKDNTNVKNLAKYVSGTSVMTGYNASSSNWVYSNTKKEVRPVITVSSKHVTLDYK